MDTTWKPIILLGAARSGTKIVRDVMAGHPDLDRVPYDINYLWRLGNEDLSHDELKTEMFVPDLRQEIVEGVERYWAGAPCLLEKTVSNCLRVSYVNAVFPDAKFIHLVRNGYDVVESAYRQWTASPDWAYIMKKFTQYPLLKAPGYAISYAGRIVRGIVLGSETKSWGPRFQSIDRVLSEYSVWEVCAIQWATCVERARQGLSELHRDRVLHIRYEDFVRETRESLEKVAQFIGLEVKPYQDLNLKRVSDNHIGKGCEILSHEEIKLIRPHMQRTLTELGYGI